MRELASQNGLQLRCPQGEDERARHQREVQRRIKVCRRPVVALGVFESFSRRCCFSFFFITPKP